MHWALTHWAVTGVSMHGSSADHVLSDLGDGSDKVPADCVINDGLPQALKIAGVVGCKVERSLSLFIWMIVVQPATGRWVGIPNKVPGERVFKIPA